jgi:hypothetical protein
LSVDASRSVARIGAVSKTTVFERSVFNRSTQSKTATPPASLEPVKSW